MSGSHPLSATFVWPIEIQVHCENQGPSKSPTRDIKGNRLFSSLITWVPVIGSGDNITCPHPETRKRGRISSEEILFWEEKRVK